MDIDWTDKRAIGLKCWFSDGESDEVLDYFTGISNAGWMMFNSKENGNDFDNCRIAQGEKTAYDGKGQPVPDGVEVKVWMRGGIFTTTSKDITSTNMSEYVKWGIEGWDADVTYFQVQEEMPKEKQTRTKIPAGTASVVNAATGEKITLDTKTVPIKQSTIDEIVDCLENGREYIEVEHNRYKELNQYPSYARGEAMCKNELDAIDKLIKELKDKE